MNIFKNGQVAHYKQMFPNTSFPASGPSDEFLASAGAYKVSMFRDHDRATQKLVSCEPVVQNGFAYVVAVEDKTAEDISADSVSNWSILELIRWQSIFIILESINKLEIINTYKYLLTFFPLNISS